MTEDRDLQISVRSDIPRVPLGLGKEGKALWKQIWGAVPDEYEFDEREIVQLTNACKMADTIARLEDAINEHGVMIRGANGQPRLNSAVPEQRQARHELDRMLGGLELPAHRDSESEPESMATKRARSAANKRWGNVHPLPGQGQFGGGRGGV